MRPSLHSLLAAMLLAASLAADAAGSVKARFVEPEKFTDIGLNAADRRQALDALQGHLESLAARLPAGQELRIEVLDVTLAGRQEPNVLQGTRVVRGRADWPRMKLRYELNQGAQVLKSGNQTLSDMAYTFGTPPAAGRSEPFPYERRMLDEWFEKTILPATPR